MENTIYWVRKSLDDGSVVSVFKTKEWEGYCYDPEKGIWARNDALVPKLRWEDDYDDISESEAMRAISELEESRRSK